MAKKKKKRWGDRRDGELIRDIDSMHFITPLIHPNRCDNEAFLPLRIDMAPVLAYVERKNAEDSSSMLSTYFHVITAALLKLIVLRPQLNRFIANHRIYQRSYVSASFTVKKKFSDDGDETLAVVHADENTTMADIHAQIAEQMRITHSSEGDSSTQFMDRVKKMPRFISSVVAAVCRFLDRRGKVPKSFIASDPFYSSAVLSNVGPMGLEGGFHHLTNWGTCSIFCLIGKKKKTASIEKDGSVKIEETCDLGFTLDERIADGYYYAKSMRIFRRILAHPEILDQPFRTPVPYTKDV